jgi:hypothetical protein
MPNLNVRPETGSDIYRFAGNARLSNGQNNTADPIVNAKGPIQLKDLEGAITTSQSPNVNSAAYKDAIFLETQNAQGQSEYVKVDLTDPANRAAIEGMITDLKNGQSVKLDAKNLNVISTNRPTTLPFAFNSQRLDTMTHSRSETTQKAATGIQNAFRDFEYTHMKDGQTLTDQQKLNLSVTTMNKLGIDNQTQKQLIGELFYNSSGNDSERVHTLATNSAGDVTVSFVHIANSGDTKAIEPQNFPAVQAYTGVDDQGHQAYVDRIHQGVYNSRILADGTSVQEPIEGKGTHLSAHRDDFTTDFLASEKGRPFQTMTPEQRKNSSAYQSALADYKIAAQRKYVDWGAHEALQALDTEVKQAIAGELSYNELADMALQVVMGLSDGNLNMKSHTTPTMEDEAAVAAFMDQVEQKRVTTATGVTNKSAGVRTNYDNDTGRFNVSDGSNRPVLKAYQTRVQ